MAALTHLKTRLRNNLSLCGMAIGLFFALYVLYGVTMQSTITELGTLQNNLDKLRSVYKETMISLEAVDTSVVKTNDGAINSHIYGAVDVGQVLKSMKEYQKPSQAMMNASRAGVDIDKENLEFNTEYKNPCWFVRGRKIRCLPSVYIVGFPYCSAIDVWYKVTRHPDVLSIPIIENNWWTRLRYQDVSLMRYGRFYAKFVESAPNNKQKIIVQSSAETMWDSGSIAMANSFGAPEVLPAHMMKVLVPAAKLLLIMRDPTQRIFIEFLRKTKSKGGGMLENFHVTVKDMIKTMYDCFGRRSIRECAYDPSIFPGCQVSKGCIQAGLYVIFVSDWLKVFPREQFHFIRAEDTTDRNLKGVLRDIFSFMSFERRNNATIDIIASKVLPSLEGSAAMKHVHQPMLKKTRKMLDDFYRPFNEALNQILGDTMYSWHKINFEKGPRSRDIYEKDDDKG